MESRGENAVQLNPQLATQPENMNREFLELNEVIDLINSNSVENLAELFQPQNSTMTSSDNPPNDTGNSCSSFIKI